MVTSSASQQADNNPFANWPPLDDYPDITRFKTSYALRDPQSGEVYWRMETHDGRINVRVTEKAADEIKWLAFNRVLPHFWFGLAVTALSLLYLHYGAPDVGAGGIVGGVIFLVGAAYAVWGALCLIIPYQRAVNNTTFPQNFIREMKRREYEARLDMAALQGQPDFLAEAPYLRETAAARDDLAHLRPKR